MSHAARYDTIIIGAGLSGLAAGIRLAQYDQRVVVLERHYLWGGLNSFFKRAGRRFDVGLHALTNFVPQGTRHRPLTRILRQLRIPWEQLELGEQYESRVVFPDTQLRFTNDIEVLRTEVAEHFPSEAQGFDRLVTRIAAGGYDVEGEGVSTRAVLAEFLRDPLLVDMLMHPLLWYGSPTPDDIEWPSFVVLWKSIYEEGFARPRGGVRPLLDLLRKRFLELGGELRLRAGVSAVRHERGEIRGVVLDDGSELEGARVLSSAGWVETMQMCGAEHARAHGEREAGQLSFVESTSVLDTTPADLGFGTTITFYNLAPRTIYGVPDEAVDVRSGVVCCPTNYHGQDPDEEPVFRVTVLASSRVWEGLPDERYYALKDEVWNDALEAVSAFAPDVREHTVFRDVFTPRTIHQFTGHWNGAVYGAPTKRRSGETPIEGLVLIGTDQGYLGVVGAMLSGISMANRHALMPA